MLLNAHLERYQHNMHNLCPSSISYTAALFQLVFSAIAQATSDSLAIFGKELAYTFELMMWATKQMEVFAVIVKQHVLASSAAAGGLRATAECVQIALGHCSSLEAHGLALCPVLSKLFMPCVELAVNASLKRIEVSTAALVADEDWVLTNSSTAARQSGRPSSAYLAHRFNLMAQVK